MNIFIMLTVLLCVISIVLCTIIYHLMDKIDRMQRLYHVLLDEQRCRVIRLYKLVDVYEEIVNTLEKLIPHYNRDSKGRFAKAKTK